MSLDVYERMEPVIGLTLHGRLRTRTKLFSPAPSAREKEQASPNTRVHPFDLGHPGTLPVLNEHALALALRLGLATGCRVARRSTFEREHDAGAGAAKGYRITQREAPLCYEGAVEVPAASTEGDGQPGTRRVRLRRVILEEDAGNVLSDTKVRRVDLNDAGEALVEVVTEPDVHSPREAALFVEKMRRLVRYLGVSEARLDDGSLRCTGHVSLRRRGGEALGPPVTLEGLTSVRHLEHALRYEAARQAQSIEGGTPVQRETRRWDAEAGQSRPLREAEPGARYLPEPDLPPVVVEEALLKKVRASMPERPEERRARFVEDIGLPPRAAALLTEDRALADFYEETVSRLYKLTGGGNTRRQAQRAAHFLLKEGRPALAQHAAPIDALPVTPRRAAKLVYLLLEETLDADAAREVFAALLAGRDADPEAIAREEDLLEGTDRDDLVPVVDEMLKRHSKNVHKYKSGKKELIHSFVGEVCSSFDEGDTPDANLVREMIEERLH